jgi:uncharacterized protein YceK
LRVPKILLFVVVIGALVAGCSSISGKKSPTPSKADIAHARTYLDQHKSDPVNLPAQAKQPHTNWARGVILATTDQPTDPTGHPLWKADVLLENGNRLAITVTDIDYGTIQPNFHPGDYITVYKGSINQGGMTAVYGRNAISDNIERITPGVVTITGTG